MADGPECGLALIERIEGSAASAYPRALEPAAQPAERALLERRLAKAKLGP
jgi:predicted RNA polymerase sigma factor